MFQKISVNEAKTMIQNEDVQILDIRDINAFQQEHIDGALHLTNGNLESLINELSINVPTLVYCYHGNSSQNAAAYLTNRQFTNVYSLDGGYEAWRQQ